VDLNVRELNSGLAGSSLPETADVTRLPSVGRTTDAPSVASQAAFEQGERGCAISDALAGRCRSTFQTSRFLAESRRWSANSTASDQQPESRRSRTRAPGHFQTLTRGSFLALHLAICAASRRSRPALASSTYRLPRSREERPLDSLRRRYVHVYTQRHSLRPLPADVIFRL